MVWHVRLKSENSDELLIEYSYSLNTSCDGLLKYNKPSKAITIERMSEGADDFYTKWLFGQIHRLLREEGITKDKRRICIG